MKRFFLIICLVFLLSSCKVKFENPSNEQFTTVEEYNELVRKGASTEFKNYYFIDLRSRANYLVEYVSNFHYSFNIEYRNENDLEKIIEAIESKNKAGFMAPIILLDTGEENDNSSTIVYNLLIERGYVNCKDVLLGFKGLKENYKTGFPYQIKDGSDCGCS